jgi:hypothetical protein
MNFGKYLSLSRKERQPGGVKAERSHYSVTYNPSTIKPEQMLLINIPLLAQNTLIVPGTMKLVFNIDITGDDDSWFINNLAANLINRIDFKWGGKTLLNIDNFHILQTYKDLWLTTNQRNNLIKRGIQKTNLSKLRSNAKSGTANATDTRLKRIFGNKYEIPLDFTFFTDQHPFYPFIYKEAIEIDLYFQKPNLVINSGTTSAVTHDYKLSNISFEYDTIYEPQLANQIIQLSDTMGITYLYDFISYIGMNSIDQSDLSFTLTINSPKKSARGILLLFTLESETANRDPENYFYPEITNVDITINGIPNKIFTQGYKEDQMWTEVRKLFLNEHRKYDDQSYMSLLEFYSSKFGLWIDLRSTDDNTLHGNGMKIETGSTISLKFTKNNTGSGSINVHTYLIADAQFTLINRFATDPQY